MTTRIQTLVLSAVLAASLAVPMASTVHADGWEVAGVVNVGEPTMRIVYDSNVYGARTRAIQLVRYLQGEFWYLPQPGDISGLMQVGYSDHYQGVQLQLYSNNPYIGVEMFNLLEYYGINMTGCWENPMVCPTWAPYVEPANLLQ